MKPKWFVLIQYWVPQGMGETGITLPFLCGALALSRGETMFSINDLRKLLGEIISRPVAGYVTEIRWCNTIDAPVLTVSRLEDALPFAHTFKAQNGQISLGFSEDSSGFFGFDCHCSNLCLEKLIEYAAPHIEQSKFSRSKDFLTRKYKYGPFLPNEIEYIQNTISVSEVSEK